MRNFLCWLGFHRADPDVVARIDLYCAPGSCVPGTNSRAMCMLFRTGLSRWGRKCLHAWFQCRDCRCFFH